MSPIGFGYVSKERAKERPFYSVLTVKGKNRRKNVIRSGTYKTKAEARKEAEKIAITYNLNIRIFDLRKQRKRKTR